MGNHQHQQLCKIMKIKENLNIQVHKAEPVLTVGTTPYAVEISPQILYQHTTHLASATSYIRKTLNEIW
jgi:hypothetical protein